MKKLITLVMCLVFSSVTYADTCIPETGTYKVKARKRWGTCENFEGVIVLEATNNQLVHCKGGYEPLLDVCGISVDLDCVDYDAQIKEPLGRITQVGRIVRKDDRNLHGVIEFALLTMQGGLLCRSLYDIEYQKL